MMITIMIIMIIIIKRSNFNNSSKRIDLSIFNYFKTCFFLQVLYGDRLFIINFSLTISFLIIDNLFVLIFFGFTRIKCTIEEQIRGGKYISVFFIFCVTSIEPSSILTERYKSCFIFNISPIQVSRISSRHHYKL